MAASATRHTEKKGLCVAAVENVSNTPSPSEGRGKRRLGRRGGRGAFSALLLLLPLSAVPASAPTEPAFTITKLQHAADTVKPETDGAKLILRIRSTKGIGFVTLTPKQNPWPNQVTVLLDSLNELEHFQLQTGRMIASGSRKTSGHFTLSLMNREGDTEQASTVGTLNITVTKQKNGIAVVLPAKLLAEKTPVTLHWIDWYRH